MKIGFVLDDRLDKPDGVQQYVTLLGSWLSAQGHEVHYLVGESPRATQSNVHHLGKTINVRFNKNRMAVPLPASKKFIKDLLLKHDFDILHVQMPYSPLLAGRIIKAAPKKTKIVGTFHILPHGKLSAVGTKLLSSLLRNNKKRFSGFISVSSAAQTFAKSHFGINSDVLPNVVDVSLFRTGKKLPVLSDKQNIVFLGRFVDRKGVLLLIAAYEKMLQQHPALMKITRLVLCGDGPQRMQVEEKAAELRKRGATVVCTGFIQESEKKDYLASANIAVFPSTGGESFGIVLIEAMAAGAGVVLGGDNPGYATVLGQQPLSIIDPYNSDLFAERLLLFLQNEAAANLLHNQQQQLVGMYDIGTVGPHIVALYQRLLAQNK